MQNKYVGDIGDFGKFALLRNVIGDNFKLGINWYLIPNDELPGGKIINFFDNNRFNGYDDELKEILKKIVEQKKRNIKELENADIFNKNTIYCNDILEYGMYENFISGNLINKYRKDNRNIWHKNALKMLIGCDIVFLDPDNGINANNKTLYRKNGNKYILKN